MSKVKPKAVGRDQRAELFDMGPEQIAQGRMDQMGRRMISRGILPRARLTDRCIRSPSRMVPVLTDPLWRIIVGTGRVVSLISRRPSGPTRTP